MNNIILMNVNHQNHTDIWNIDTENYFNLTQQTNVIFQTNEMFIKDVT